MSRIHGRNGRLYAGIASGGTAEPITFLTKWSIDFVTADVDVTALGDANKVYVAGLPDAQGTYTGFYDDATSQLFTSAVDGVSRKFYLYPNISTSQYWFGTALFDFKVNGDVSTAVGIDGSWHAASTVSKVG